MELRQKSSVIEILPHFLHPPNFCGSGQYLCCRKSKRLLYYEFYASPCTHVVFNTGRDVRIEDLFNKAEEYGMRGLAITDHGTMSGVPEFLKPQRNTLE